MAAQVVEREPGRVGLRVRRDGEVEEEVRDVGVEVHGVEEAVGQVLLRDVLAGPWQEAVVRKRVEEWAWAADFWEKSTCVS